MRRRHDSLPALRDPTPPSPALAGSRIDCAGALTDAAKHAARPAATDTGRAFGVPMRASEADSRAPEFGWDYAHTHRSESLPGDGIVVSLNDECVLMPLPLALCGIGKRAANGELFKHMHDHASATDAQP